MGIVSPYTRIMLFHNKQSSHNNVVLSMEAIVRMVNMDIFEMAKSVESHSFGRPRRKLLQKC